VSCSAKGEEIAKRNRYAKGNLGSPNTLALFKLGCLRMARRVLSPSRRRKCKATPVGAKESPVPEVLRERIDAAVAEGFAAQATSAAISNLEGAATPAEPIPARMLNEFVYCPRLFYYEFVEGVFVHNADTVRGAAIHARVDLGRGELPPAEGGGSEISDLKSQIENEVIHSRSVSLGSERLGVTAKIDLVEVRASPPRGENKN
jgi:hypothetical protein